MAGAAAAKEPTVRTAEAEPADEIFEIEDLPEGVELETAEAKGEEPAAEVVEEPAKGGKAKAAKKPAAKEDDRLPASTREEREKRKKYAKLWEETEAEKEKLEAQLRAARGQQPTTSKLSPEQRAALKEKANKAETMGDLLEIALDEIERRDARVDNALGEERFNRFLHVSESIARGRFSQYDKVLKEAGILDAVAVKDNGQFTDPAVANKIYRSADPGEMAYTLALGRLEKDGRVDEVLGTQSGTDEVVEEVEPEVKPGKGKSEKPSDERRAGAREVIEAVAGNSSKPRGLSSLKAAPPPKRGVTRKDLDRMSNEDPNGLATLFKAQPKLKEWWLGGVDSV
jgi:DNA polymerase III gamma/tau subunit